MTFRVPLREVRPDLRILTLDEVDGVDLLLPDRDGSAAALRLRSFSDPDARLETDQSGDDLVAELEARWAAPPAEDSPLYAVAQLVIALDAFDSACRDSGVFVGNVYLASEAAVDAVLGVAELTRRADDLAELLTALQFAELMYRFPVAYKFRGTHSVERQCRLNGWGRLLAERLATLEWSRQISRDARDAVRSHVASHADAYARHLSACLTARDDGEGHEWERALELPVPVLT
ncbi:hypothetical protein [Curtobacterium sp. 9128]|uniref:hypothetical protein n=1 Tax=Curtobacterium sp. 9128 TaxID=1793722 RepID=UPI0011A38AEF|nr:hypothetical protein [Curtobacterium sp. 9128]